MFLDFLLSHETLPLTLGSLTHYVNGEEARRHSARADIERPSRSPKVSAAVSSTYLDLWCSDFDVGETCGRLLSSWEAIVSFAASRIVPEPPICTCRRMWLYYRREPGDVRSSGTRSNGRIKVYCSWKAMVCE